MELSARPVTLILISGALVSCGPGAMEGEGRGFHLSSSVSLLRISHFGFQIADGSTEEALARFILPPSRSTTGPTSPCALFLKNNNNNNNDNNNFN